MSGKLTLVGTGPGDPELMTLKAVRVITGADVVAYPGTEDEPGMAYRIAEAHVPNATRRIPIHIPMETARAAGQAAYDALAGELLPLLREGKTVAYLCEGDPLFYGSAMYLIDRLADDAEIEIVPGITSLTATAAAIRRPLAGRNDVIKVLPATLDDARLRHELDGAEAVAIIKVGRHFARIKALLERTGHAQSAMIVEYATHDRQKVSMLADYGEDERPYFSTILTYRGDEAWG
ncbi:precorrin-2 C(20)-methyltransferase [Cucumibacter marinus]|uniref:precorrin-2 C(20)-methyltransferase n=1 Tax=Cucumibacter marinus TaxID=1121252 RepID=UPI0003F7DE19|nr:precorrin-2 C(20)-methyltransferase [Cucumibacter marinus]